MEHRNINTVGTIFNDFLGLYTGERPVGIHELIQKYDRHPVLMGLLSNVDSVIYVDVKKAMYEIYPFYKKYRHRALDDNAWKDIVESAETLEKKWNENLWVRRVILNLVNELDKESQEVQRAAAGGNAENQHPKRHNDGGTLYAGKIGKKHRGSKCPGRTLPDLSKCSGNRRACKRMFHIQRGHGCFYSGKKEVSAEGFVNPAVSVTEKLTEEMLLLQDSGYATVLGTYLLDLARKILL